MSADRTRDNRMNIKPGVSDDVQVHATHKDTGKDGVKGQLMSGHAPRTRGSSTMAVHQNPPFVSSIVFVYQNQPTSDQCFSHQSAMFSVPPSALVHPHASRSVGSDLDKSRPETRRGKQMVRLQPASWALRGTTRLMATEWRNGAVRPLGRRKVKIRDKILSKCKVFSFLFYFLVVPMVNVHCGICSKLGS